VTKLEDKLERAKVKQLERALQQERTGLQAIATACLEEARDPEALLHRLELMADNAVRTNKPQRLRDVIVYGLDIYKRALERHELKPQRLFEVGPGCEQDESVLELARPRAGSGRVVSPSEEHRERSAAEEEIRRRILSIYEFEGGMSDLKLVDRYTHRHGPIAATQLWRQRKFLTSSGVVANRGGIETPESYIWDLTERHPRFAETTEETNGRAMSESDDEGAADRGIESRTDSSGRSA
jgi:hypothetical protein